MKEYRSANEKVRSAPSPKYFQEFPRLNIPDLDSIKDTGDDQLEKIRDEASAGDQDAAKARSLIIGAFKSNADKLPDVIKESTDAALEIIKQDEEFAKAT